MRNRTSRLRIPRSNALPLSEVDYKVPMTRVLHTARISKVDSVMFVNRIREIVSFELAKEIERDVFRLVTSVGLRKNFIYKHDAIDIADPNSIQDACHMNFVIDLPRCRVAVA